MKKKIVLVLIIVIALIFIGDIYISKNKHENSQETEAKNNLEENNSLENANQVESEITTNATNKEKQNEIDNTNQSEQISTTENTKNEDMELKKQVAPRGFMGSSAYKVNLYSNGDVYIITYDGNGYEDNNIISKDIIAKNAQNIEMAEDEEQEGAVIVKGGEIINNNFGWISFSK